jgi:hypothetical protein
MLNGKALRRDPIGETPKYLKMNSPFLGGHFVLANLVLSNMVLICYLSSKFQKGYSKDWTTFVQTSSQGDCEKKEL